MVLYMTVKYTVYRYFCKECQQWFWALGEDELITKLTVHFMVKHDMTNAEAYLTALKAVKG